MPPRTRKETPEAILFVDDSGPLLSPENPHEVRAGSIVNLVVNGASRHKAAEVLFRDNFGLTVRTHPQGLSLSEVTLVPWSAIEGVGIVGAR